MDADINAGQRGAHLGDAFGDVFGQRAAVGVAQDQNRGAAVEAMTMESEGIDFSAVSSVPR